MSIDMVRDTLNAAYEAMHRAGQLLASIAPILRGLRPGQTAVFRSSYETSGEEEIHEGETRTAPTAGGLVTIADICRKGQELITMCREFWENGTEPLPEEGHIQKERVQEDFNKLSTEKRSFSAKKSTETVVSKDTDGHGFSAHRTTQSEKLYGMPNYLKKFYGDVEKQPTGKKENQ